MQRSAGLRDRLAGDQRPRLVRPAILVMQAGQRRPGQRVEGLPAARAAVPRLAASLAPGTNVIPTAVRTAKARNPTPPDLRQQVFPGRGIVRLRDRERGRNSSLTRQRSGADRVSRRVNRIVRFGQRQFPQRLCALRPIQKPNSAKPSRKRRRIHLTHPPKPGTTLSSFNRVRNKSEKKSLLDRATAQGIYAEAPRIVGLFGVIFRRLARNKRNSLLFSLHQGICPRARVPRLGRFLR